MKPTVSNLDAVPPSNRIYSPKRDRRARTLASPHCFCVSARRRN
jgi:hypothetical protein